MTEKNQPKNKYRAGSITATLWENKKTIDNKELTFQTVNIDRNYKDKEDKWQTTNTLRTNDIPKAILVLQKAYEELALKENDNETEKIED